MLSLFSNGFSPFIRFDKEKVWFLTLIESCPPTMTDSQKQRIPMVGSEVNDLARDKFCLSTECIKSNWLSENHESYFKGSSLCFCFSKGLSCLETSSLLLFISTLDCSVLHDVVCERSSLSYRGEQVMFEAVYLAST